MCILIRISLGLISLYVMLPLYLIENDNSHSRIDPLHSPKVSDTPPPLDRQRDRQWNVSNHFPMIYFRLIYSPCPFESPLLPDNQSNVCIIPNLISSQWILWETGKRMALGIPTNHTQNENRKKISMKECRKVLSLTMDWKILSHWIYKIFYKYSINIL